jgi:hypothetical protein
MGSLEVAEFGQLVAIDPESGATLLLHRVGSFLNSTRKAFAPAGYFRHANIHLILTIANIIRIEYSAPYAGNTQR